MGEADYKKTAVAEKLCTCLVLKAQRPNFGTSWKQKGYHEKLMNLERIMERV